MLASNIQRDGYHMDLFTIFKREDNASLIKFDQNLAQLEWVNSDLINSANFIFMGAWYKILKIGLRCFLSDKPKNVAPIFYLTFYCQ